MCWEDKPCKRLTGMKYALVSSHRFMSDRSHSRQTENGKLVFPRIPSGGRHRESYGSWQQLNRGPCSPYMDGNRHANLRPLTPFESTMSLNDKKAKVRRLFITVYCVT